MTKPADGPMFPRRPADLIFRASAGRPADGSVSSRLQGLGCRPAYCCTTFDCGDLLNEKVGKEIFHKSRQLCNAI